MCDNIFDKLPKEQLFEELTHDNLKEVIDIVKLSNSDESHCIIFDDMTAYLKNKETLQQLKELIFNRRHLHVSIFFLCQTWFSIPKDIRKLFTNVFVFKVSKVELSTIFEELIEQKKELILDISKLVFNTKYQFLFTNVESQRLFKNWDEILISDDCV